MSYSDILRRSAKRSGSISCMGIDPDIERIPIQGSPEKAISKFFIDILNEADRNKIHPAAVKPNIAFFEQYGFEGLKALKNLLAEYRSAGIPVILDAKRGDIGKTSTAYARSIFDFWQADATTIAPYMGEDSVGPFLEYHTSSKGFYILTRTSNKGAKDIQDIRGSDGSPLYITTAKMIIEWYKPGIGSVIGATYPEELKEILELFKSSGKDICLLIPGVGSQGASAAKIMEILKASGTDIHIHRINSSSAISYAFEKKGSKEYAKSACEALANLIEETAI